MSTEYLKPNDTVEPLIHTLKVAVFQCEPTEDGKLTFINHSGAKILGCASPDEAVGTYFHEYFSDSDNFADWFTGHEKTGTQLDFETLCKRKDGKNHSIGITSSLVYDSKDNKIRINGIFRDIHSNKKDELIREVISNINEILLSNLDMRKVYHLICGELYKIIHWERVSITLVAEKENAVVNFALTKSAYKGKSELVRKMVQEDHYSLRGSMLKKVVESGKPVIVKDTFDGEIITDKVYAASGIRSRLGYPLKFKGEIIGSINFGSSKVDYYNDEHIKLLEKITPSLTFGIKNTEKLDEGLENEVIANINKTLVTNLNMKEVDHIICDELYKLIEWDRVSIVLLENKDDVVVNFALTRSEGKDTALSKTMPEKSHFPLIGSILEKVIGSGKPYIVDDTSDTETETDQIYAKEGIKSRLAFPLEYKDEIIGSINFGCSKLNYYNEGHIKVLKKIGPSLAFGIENTKLYERATKAEKEYSDLTETVDKLGEDRS
ncbi:MAG: GAF domain-containing protein [Candidatus Anammoxibacter sp.]